MGYVQVQLRQDVSVVLGKVTPEHKVKQPPYSVAVQIINSTGEIEFARCYGCAAQMGGCKHAVAFIFWLYRRTVEKAVTEVQCYWTKPRLSKVGTLSPVKAKQLVQKSKHQMGPLPPQPNFLQQVLQKMDQSGNSNVTGVVFGMCQATPSNCKAAEMKVLCQGCPDVSAVCSFLAGKVTAEMVADVCAATRGQSQSPAWYHLRFGRVTASRLYEAAHCKTAAGSLVESMLGYRSTAGSQAMQRGLALEPKVLKSVSKRLGTPITATGLHILPDRPMFAGSPDGLCTLNGVQHVVEVKCPVSVETVEKYVDEAGAIFPKVRAQLQLQMLAAGVEHGLLCVADPQFEKSGAVCVVYDELDMGFLGPIMDQAERFWRMAVLPMLL